MALPETCRRVASLVSLAMISAAGVSSAATDSLASPFHVDAAEVRLTFSVVDHENHGVMTLQANDFAVVDNDIIVRDFQSFGRSEWTKLEIAILIDGSESVRPRFRQEIIDILELVSQTAGIPEENLSMFSFRGLDPILLCSGDCRASHAVDRLPSTRAGGLTPLFDTIVFASDSLAHQSDVQSEKVLILFSDGDDTISRTTLSNATDAALVDDVQIYCIDLNNSAEPTPGATVLYSLARATGGRYFPAHDGATSALDAILESFHANYTVSYRLPSHDTGFHSIRILPTHNLNLQFRSRSGYYYPNPVR